jgi:hypothetical protein
MNPRLRNQRYEPKGGTKDARCATCANFDKQWVQAARSGHPQRWCIKAEAVVDESGVCHEYSINKRK